jgi:FO synthase
MPPERMEALIRSAGRLPRQRTTLYGDPPAGQVERSFDAPPLAEPLNPPVAEERLSRPRRLLRPLAASS